MSLSFRSFRRKDGADVARMMRALAAFHGEVSKVAPSYIAKHALGLNKRFDFLVAAEGKNIVGFIATSYGHNLPLMQYKARTEYLFVEENHRNQGIGRKLILAALRKAIKKGCVEYDLTAAPQNKAANKTYRAMGFLYKDIKRIRYYADQVTMKQLDSQKPYHPSIFLTA